MVAMIDGPMIIRLIENPEEFNKYAEENLRRNQEKPTSTMAEEGGDVESEKYKAELRDMMMAVAEGIGNTPLNVLIEEGSFLKKAYEIEVLRIEKEQVERLKKMKIIEENNFHNNNNNKNREVQFIVVPRKKSFKKKRSFSLLTFCACTGKHFVDQ